MKPAFALDLRDDAIGLLHRSGTTWQQVGGVAMDEPDLTGALSYLRATALGLSPRGITTKLVIPNDQILYTTVSAPGPDDESRRTQIRAALDGRTPYAPEDLVFDWSGAGDEVQVAVVARETLDEAEGFAVRHRFNPIAFVAVPDDGTFDGEPWFGPSALSVSLLSGIDRVERDNQPVLDIRRNFEPDLPPEDDAQVEPVLVQPDLPLPGTPDEAEPTPTPLEDPAFPENGMPEPPPEIAPPTGPELPPPADPMPPEEQESLPAQLLSQAIRPLLPPVVEEAPMALDVLPEDVAPLRPSVIDPAIEDDIPGPAAGMAFSSRRAPDAVAAGGGRTGGRTAVGKPAIAKPLAATKGLAADSGAMPRPSAPAVARNGRPAAVKPGAGSLDAPGAKSAKRPNEEGAVAAAALTAAQSAVARPAQPKPATTTGLSGRAVAPPRKARHLGLILTGVLLLFLALVAAWSSIFLTAADDPAQPEAVQTAANQPVEPPAAIAPPAAQDQAQDLAAADAVADQPAAPELAALPPASGVQSSQAAPAVTAQPSEQGQDEIFLATMDAPPQTPDPSALPDPEARGDSLPQSQAAPPPFGTTYQFDAEGRIKPTPDGIITPEGVTLVAGKPPRLPLPRPAALATPVAANPAASPAVETPFPSDPALAGARPKSRPAVLSVPAPGDGAALDPLAVPATAPPDALRPRLRPAAIAALAPPAQPDNAVPAQGAAAASIASLDQPGSLLAIAISRRPAARPAAINPALEAAVAEAARPEARPEPPPQQPDAQPEQPSSELAVAAASESNVRLPNPEPEADSEPEAASAAPSIPTRASVAKQATLKNAFDLGKTNLIGVYGTPSKRYALVRTSSGGFKKVRPGDRVDGGRVVSIGDDELRVQKGGRTLVLALPKT